MTNIFKTNHIPDESDNNVSENDSSTSQLDFLADPPKKNDSLTLGLGGQYDPRPQEDSARRYIAYWLIGLLWAIVAALLFLLCIGRITPADIKEFAVLLGPIVTLVSAATGFYYGTKSKH